MALHSLLRTQGYFVTDEIVPAHKCACLAEDTGRAVTRGPTVSGPAGALRAIALLAHSDRALELLDDEKLSLWVKRALDQDLILSRAEGVTGPRDTESAWQSDFREARRHLSSRAFRPGFTLWIPLKDEGGTLDVIRSSQHMNGCQTLPDKGLTPVRLLIAQGCAVLLEGGAHYRLAGEKALWLCLAFIRPWMKPEVLFASALSPDRLSRLGRRGRHWCGLDIGLPTTVEEFLEIEAAALESEFGRVKGSGI
jgi:hypothetical protein